MSDDLVKRLRSMEVFIMTHTGLSPVAEQAADRIEQLEARVLLLEGWLNGSLNIIESFVAADTTEARAALGEKKDD